MAMPHAKSGNVIEVRPLGAEISDHKTYALFKSRDLEVMRLVLKEGKSLPSHKVPGDITVHCLEGKMDVTTAGVSHVLAAGQMLFLSGGIEHAVVGVEDSSALVTIALKSP